MTDDRSLERAARSWLENGPTEAPDRAVEAALLRIETTPQERDWHVPWRLPKMTTACPRRHGRRHRRARGRRRLLRPQPGVASEDRVDVRRRRRRPGPSPIAPESEIARSCPDRNVGDRSRPE